MVSNLETAEPLWFGRERKNETLDELFEKQLKGRQRRAITAPCLEMWAPFRLSIAQWAPNYRIIYDKFHIMKHADAASRVLSQGGTDAGTRNRQALVAAESLEESGYWPPPATERAVCTQPPHPEILSGAMLNYLQGWIRRGCRHKNLRNFLLKAQRMAIARTEFVIVDSTPKDENHKLER